MDNNRNPTLEKLLQGIATDHVETVRDAWRGLLILGETVIPAILNKLDTKTWAEKPRGPALKYLGVLLALLNEIDPAIFQQEIARLLSSKLHPLHRQTVEIMSKRCGDQVSAYVGPNIPVYVSNEISDAKPVLANLDRWVQTRNLGLAGVTRIDVIAKHSHMDYLGRYDLFFSGIILTWPTKPARGLRLWEQSMSAKFTFYHEIGHHACGHLEGGQVAEQEEEANSYARRMLHNAHPVLMATGRILFFPFRPLLRKYTNKKQ